MTELLDTDTEPKSPKHATNYDINTFSDGLGTPCRSMQ